MLRLPIALHPGAAALDRFVDHGAGVGERAGVARHLVRCARCRGEVAFRRSLRDAVAALPAPAPSPAVLARALDARARGERVILPATSPRQRPRFSRSSGGVAIAGLATAVVAAAATLVAIAPRYRDMAPIDVPSVPDDWFVSGGSFAGVSGAVESPAHGAPPPPVGALADTLAGARLRPRALMYATRWENEAGVGSAFGATGTFVLDRAAVDGAPAWRVAVEWRGVRTEAETLFVLRDDLRPIDRAVHVAPYGRGFRALRVEQRFAGDSVLGEMRAEGLDGHEVRRPVASALPDGRGPVVTDAIAPLFLAAVELRLGWAGSVSMLGWAVRPDDVVHDMTLRVVGEERVTVPAGTFDCWRLAVVARGIRLDYWVRKRDGVAVRSRDAVMRRMPNGARHVRELLLVRDDVLSDAAAGPGGSGRIGGL